MRVLYVSIPFYFDMDLSLIKELSNISDTYYLLDIPTYARKSTALNLNNSYNKSGIWKAGRYDELKEFSSFIDTEKTWIINRTSAKSYSYSNIKLQFQLIKKIKQINPDIIHINDCLELNNLYLLLSNKFPKVITIHDPFPHSGEYSFRKEFFRKITFRLFNNFILLNQSQKDKFIETYLLQNKKIYTSKLGCYTYLNKYPTNNHVDNQNQKILFFGRISPYKGIEFLLSAFESVQKKYSNVNLIIAGSGNFYFDIAKYNSNKSIKIINRFISNYELASLITNCSFVVCPYTDATQSGVVMSSFTFNKPVIATNVGGIAETVVHEKYGILIKPKDSNDLANAISDLIDNPGKLSKLSANIDAKYFKGDSSWKEICSALNNIYINIILNENF